MIMNGFWVKIVILAVIVACLVVGVKVFKSSNGEPKPEPKGLSEQFDEDDARLRAEPETETDEERLERRKAERADREKLTAERRAQIAEQDKAAELQFEELSLEDKVRAEQLFEMALFERKKGRLPVMGFKKMVDYCREIIEKWPNSTYAYKARKMLGDIPERYRERYNITDEEINPTN